MPKNIVICCNGTYEGWEGGSGALSIVFGGASRDRTDDLIVANDALSQLSYSPTVCGSINFISVCRAGLHASHCSASLSELNHAL